MKEIERKYLAVVDPDGFDFDACNKALIVEQGYVVSNERAEWRIRHTQYVKHPSYPAMTTKCFTALKFGNGFVRREYEITIPGWVYKVLNKLTQKRLHKLRLQSNGWEIDIFERRWEGLMLAECEVPSEDTPQPSLPAGLTLLSDVTDDGTFANKRLAAIPGWSAAQHCVYSAYLPHRERVVSIAGKVV